MTATFSLHTATTKAMRGKPDLGDRGTREKTRKHVSSAGGGRRIVIQGHPFDD